MWELVHGAGHRTEPRDWGSKVPASQGQLPENSTRDSERRRSQLGEGAFVLPGGAGFGAWLGLMHIT